MLTTLTAASPLLAMRTRSRLMQRPPTGTLVRLSVELGDTGWMTIDPHVRITERPGVVHSVSL